MPDDDIENHDDAVDSALLRPDARRKKKSVEFANDFVRGLSTISAIFTSLNRDIANVQLALDALVFSELAALYYADCVTTTLILRSLIQVFLSPPVNASLPAQVPNPRSHLSLILFATFLSLLLHVFGSRPAADERGYLHGLA